MSNDTPTGASGVDPDDRPDATGGDAPTERFTPAADDATTGQGSDDTPTERFAPAAPARDDLPATRILPTNGQVAPNAYVPAAVPPARAPEYRTAPAARTGFAAPSGRGPTPPVDDTPEKSRALLYWLIGIGAMLLVAVIVLLVLLFTGDDRPQPAATSSATATPTAAPSPSASPTPEPTQTPSPSPTPEPAAGPTFATFSAPSTANCEEGDDDAPLSFSWSSTDAVRAYLGVGTQNAAINPTVSDLPPTATYTDLDYDCGLESQVYTVTLEDDAGAVTSKTVTITR